MNYKIYNDYELLYMVRENDDDSYNELFSKYVPIVKRIAADFYKNFSAYGYDLDDFIQEGYVGFQRAVISFDEHKDILFYTYVTLCIHRTILTFCKRITCEKKNINHNQLVDCDSVSIPDNLPSMEEYFSSKEILKNIWDIVYTFSLDYACVFELRMNHFQYQEISELLDISIRRAQIMFRRVQSKIRKELQFSL